MRFQMSSSSTGWRKVTFITDPLLKSMPAFRPESPVIQPGAIIMDMRPGTITMAETTKYQPRLPTISSTSALLSPPGPASLPG